MRLASTPELCVPRGRLPFLSGAFSFLLSACTVPVGAKTLCEVPKKPAQGGMMEAGSGDRPRPETGVEQACFCGCSRGAELWGTGPAWHLCGACSA